MCEQGALLYNPAGSMLSAYGLNKNSYSAKMTAYIVKEEPLNLLEGPFVKPIGKVVYLPYIPLSNQPPEGVLARHSMATMIRCLNNYYGNGATSSW